MQAYAARTLVYTYLAAKRLKRSEEILASRLPEREIHSPATEYGTPDHTLSRPIKVGVHLYAILIASHGCRSRARGPGNARSHTPSMAAHLYVP